MPLPLLMFPFLCVDLSYCLLYFYFLLAFLYGMSFSNKHSGFVCGGMSSSFLKDNFVRYIYFCWQVLFFISVLWICLPTTSSLNGFWWEISFNLMEVPCYFQNSSFVFAFAIYYNVSQFWSLLVYPTLNTLSLLGMQIQVLNISSNLGKSVIIFSVNLCFSFSSSLLSGILTMSMLTCIMVSHKSLRLYLFTSFYFLSGPMIS